MGQRLSLHPETPQKRFLDRAADLLSKQGVVVLPTDTCYALTAMPGAKDAITRIARLKQFDPERKLFSLIAPDLASVSRYAVVDNRAYRILKRQLPGPYTFVLPASRELPRILGVKRKTVGLRVPDHVVAREVAARLDGLLLATTLALPGDELPLADPDEIEERVAPQVDLFLEQGWGGVEPSSLIDLTGEAPELLRSGAGEPEQFLA